MSMSNRTRLQRAVIVFPAIAMVVSVGGMTAINADSSDVQASRRTSTTVRNRPATTLPPKSTAARPALNVLNAIPRVRERPQGYDRDLFRHWSDDDGDGCNTREEVLIAESRTPAQVDRFGCKVIEGDWFSEYDGVMHTNPSSLDVDHVVALKEAWDSGAWAWSASQRQRFANDLSDSRSLIAVSAGANRSKSDKDPSNWIPRRPEALCGYISNWVAIKSRWNLSMDESEWGRVRNILRNNCPNATIAPWGSRATASAGPVGTVAPSAPQGTSAPQAPADSSAAPGSPAAPGLPQVTPRRRCKGVEFGQYGQSGGVTYVCTNRKSDGTPSAPGYYYWQPAP